MEQHYFFSMIVVCLNPGEKLKKTLDSILSQNYPYYEIVIKDGGSTDGALEGLREDGMLNNGHFTNVLVQPDSGIYDAMNQAVEVVKGDYVLFLNCGDTFFDAQVLKNTAEKINEENKAGIYYGNTFCEQTASLVASAPTITGFTCYRNIPCHQSCFYEKRLFEEKRYDLNYRIRADYDHFLWCFYKAKVKPVYLDFTVSAYEGGGYSESKENKKRDRQEHKQITTRYMSRKELFQYKLIMTLTLSGLRGKIADTPGLSKFYNRLKQIVYKK